MDKKLIRWWEIASALFVLLAGSALHFVFAWSGYWQPIAWLAPVNESVWEHLKLGFWPGLLFAVVEYLALRKASGFWAAKTLGLLTTVAAIIALHYGYTAAIGEESMLSGIAIFVIAVLLGHAIGYQILAAQEIGERARRWAWIGLAAMALALMLFSYYPPHLPLFEDNDFHQYGILERR
jgi:hypothetical protein